MQTDMAIPAPSWLEIPAKWVSLLSPEAHELLQCAKENIKQSLADRTPRAAGGEPCALSRLAAGRGPDDGHIEMHRAIHLSAET